MEEMLYKILANAETKDKLFSKPPHFANGKSLNNTW